MVDKSHLSFFARTIETHSAKQFLIGGGTFERTETSCKRCARNFRSSIFHSALFLFSTVGNFAANAALASNERVSRERAQGTVCVRSRADSRVVTALHLGLGERERIEDTAGSAEHEKDKARERDDAFA